MGWDDGIRDWRDNEGIVGVDGRKEGRGEREVR